MPAEISPEISPETSPESSAEIDAGTPVTSGDDAGALLSRLRVIEDQPLEARAAAFVQIHDQLQSTLEGSVRDGTRDSGAGTSKLHG